MAIDKPQSNELVPDRGWLTLKQASVLCGVPVDRLRTMIRSGDLHAFTITRNGKTRYRLLRAALIEAKLLKLKGESANTISFDALTLIREQNQRIAHFEDQRAQLTGQIGVILERLRTLDERVSWLESIQPVESADYIEEERTHPHPADPVSTPEPATNGAEPASAASRSLVVVRTSWTQASSFVAKKPWRRAPRSAGKD